MFFCGYWEDWGPVKRFDHTSWVAVATPTDRPKSVRNYCVIKGFGDVFVFYSCIRIYGKKIVEPDLPGLGAAILGSHQIETQSQTFYRNNSSVIKNWTFFVFRKPIY